MVYTIWNMELCLGRHLSFQLGERGIEPIGKLKNTFINSVSFDIMLGGKSIGIAQVFSNDLIGYLLVSNLDISIHVRIIKVDPIPFANPATIW